MKTMISKAQILIFTIVLVFSYSVIQAQHPVKPNNKKILQLRVQHPDKCNCGNIQTRYRSSQYLKMTDFCQIWDTDNNKWVNSDTAFYSYNSNGTLNIEQYQYWDSIKWGLIIRDIHNYNYRWLDSITTAQYWVDSTATWVIAGREYDTWDTDGSILTQTMQLSKDNGGTFYYTDRDFYIYDSTANYDASVLIQKWTGSTWVDSARFLYHFNTNGHETDNMYQEWKYGAWRNNYRVTNTLDTYGNAVQNLTEEWDSASSKWVNSYKDTKTYWKNESDKILTNTVLQWYINKWYNYYTENYTYDTSGNEIKYLQKAWDGTKWSNYYQCNYTYSLFVGIKDTGYKRDLFIMYPNPATDQVVIILPGIFSGSLLLNNNLGEKQINMNFNQKGNLQLDVSDLPAGIYYVTIRVTDTIQTVKLIKRN